MTTITELREQLDGLPREHDGDYCPVCRMPLIRGDCVRHDTEEMIAWGNKYRRDNEALEAYNAKLLDVVEAAKAYMEIKYPNGDFNTVTISGPGLDKAAEKLMDKLAGLEGGK